MGCFNSRKAYLPTSGDLKSGDSILHYTPHPDPHPPPPPPPEQIALGHYMTSYMTYMGSKCAITIVMTN